MDTYTLCEGWEKKKKELGVFIPKPEDNLLQDLTDTVYAFKSQSVAYRMAQLRDQLRTADTDQQRDLLSQLQQYAAVNRQLQQARNIVIGPRYKNY